MSALDSFDPEPQCSSSHTPQPSSRSPTLQPSYTSPAPAIQSSSTSPVPQPSSGSRAPQLSSSSHTTQPCFICCRPSAICGQCNKIAFCSDHTSSHLWGSSCFPFTVKQNSEVGRYMVATRHIRPLEVILAEPPLSKGPYTRSEVQCLGCARTEKMTYSCSRCAFPLCSQECGEGIHQIECAIFQSAGFKYQAYHGQENGENPAYAAISVIRLLSLRETRPERYAELLRFEHHSEARRELDPELWQYHQHHILDFLTQVLAINITRPELNNLIGVMFTNSADIEHPPGYGREHGFYPNYAYMNHSCRSNSRTLKFPDQRLEVRAICHIKEGEEITTQYVQPMKPTFIRRARLKAQWLFDCQCDRCQDPSELGSNLAALLCQKGRCGGVVRPVEPCDGEADWCCTTCGHLVQVEEVIDLVTTAASRLEQLKAEDIIQNYEKLLEEFSDRLHPAHYLNIQIKEKLGLLYGNAPGYGLSTLSRPLLDRKIQVCLDYLDTLGKVDPGYSIIKGKMLGELHKARELTVAMDVAKGILPRKQLEKVIKERQFLQMYLAFYKSLLFLSLS